MFGKKLKSAMYCGPSIDPQTFKPTVYIGPSMNPTLKAPDILEITPYKDISEIKVGDVIVFDSPKEPKSITHRVTKITPNGVVTRGDNNRHADPWELKLESITGRVDWSKRGKKRLRIWGGRNGRIFERYVRSRRTVLRAFTRALRPFYRFLSRIKPLKKLWPPKFSPKLVTFTRRGYKEQQLLLGPLVIGRKIPGKKWRIRPPFRMLVDETTLANKAKTLVHNG